LKVLFISRQKKTFSIDTMLDKLSELCTLTIFKLSPDEVKRIVLSLKSIDLGSYDRVVLNLPFRRIKNKHRLIKTFPNLVIYDRDTCRNYIKGDPYYNQFSRFFKRLNVFRLICTGYAITQKYREMGIDAHFVSKGYDNKILKNLHMGREIKAGFIGRIDIKLYENRKNFLDAMAKEFGINILRTYSEEEYLTTLNNMEIFVSADIGFDEYMAKNFEAMACGCMLFAKRYGNGEEDALGLKDMENVVLYNNIEDAKRRFANLLQNPQLVKEIAKNGEKLAKKRFSLEEKGAELYAALRPPMRTY